MLLRYSLGLEKEGIAVEAAVRQVLDAEDIGGFGFRTKDLGGDKSTREVGEKIAEVLKTKL
jgi:3-isopropylmalate dehydrogenase